MSYRHIAAEVGKHGGHLSSAYFGQMINGQSTNVSTAVMDALAKVFNVSPAYFTNDEDVAARQEEKWRRLDELEEHPSADLAKELVDIQLRKATLDGLLAGLDAQSRSEIEEMMAVFFQERDNLRRQS
jgi:transcriptional regulator with XRE-family HTH domain